MPHRNLVQHDAVDVPKRLPGEQAKPENEQLRGAEEPNLPTSLVPPLAALEPHRKKRPVLHVQFDAR